MMRRAPKGFTLAELVVAITLMGAVLGLIAISLQTVLQMGRRQSRQRAFEMTLLRLDPLLRSDIRQARLAAANAIDGQPLLLRLRLARHDAATVDYRIQDQTLCRTVTAAGQATHRDSFSFPRDVRLRFVLSERADSCQFAGLMIEWFDPVQSESAKPLRAQRIRAHVGGCGRMPQ